MSEKEYIERGALIEFVKQNTPNIDGDTTMQCVERAMKAAPAADVVEVRHGEWTLIGYGNGRPIHWKCSVCGYETLDAVNGDTDFCPNCGAKMDGERKEQT